MANIVDLRGRSNQEIEQMLENARAEMFNLRFQQATTRLTNTTRIQEVRSEIAQCESVLHKRQLAITAAAQHDPIAEALKGREWDATARYDYEEASHIVEFSAGGSNVATAYVDLNKKKPRTRRARLAQNAPQRVVRYEVS